LNAAELRQAIITTLINNVSTVAGRVFATFTAPADTARPFLEAGFLGELPAMNPQGMFYQWEVLCVGDDVDILTLDAVADEVITKLHDVHITTTSSPPSTFYCTYTRDGRVDQYSNDLNGLVIRLKFLVPIHFKP
jgi:hypothetical protein